MQSWTKLRLPLLIMQTPQFDVHAANEERHWWFLGRRHIVATLLQRLVPPSQEKLILDVGSGTGGMTAFLSKKYTCIGIDPSKDGIAYARKRFPQCTFVQGVAPKDVDHTYRLADAVLLLEVLEHIEHDAAFVHQLITPLKKGAYLFIMAPADMSLWSPHDIGFEHFRRYDLAGFRHLWEGQPVEEMLVSHSNARLYLLAKLMRTLSRLRGKSWGPGDTDISMPSKPLNAALERIFKGETRVLLDALEGRRKTGYRKGVTLLAVLRKTV